MAEPAAADTLVVVPCYNEAQRLARVSLESLLADPGVGLVLVDDGSVDDTPALLARFAAAHPGRVRVVTLAENSGKGEAVRRGLLAAVSAQPAIVGYYDADGATPAAEMLRLLALLRSRPDLLAALAARVLMLGHPIERRAARHYSGRLFATAASMVLGLPIYDTQCGAKLLRNTDRMRAVLDEPFLGSWTFDVELLGRLSRTYRGLPGMPAEAFVEEPLLLWHEVGGSRLTLRSSLAAARDLGRYALRSRGPVRAAAYRSAGEPAHPRISAAG